MSKHNVTNVRPAEVVPPTENLPRIEEFADGTALREAVLKRLLEEEDEERLDFQAFADGSAQRKAIIDGLTEE